MLSPQAVFPCPDHARQSHAALIVPLPLTRKSDVALTKTPTLILTPTIPLPLTHIISLTLTLPGSNPKVVIQREGNKSTLSRESTNASLAQILVDKRFELHSVNAD